MDKEPIKFRDLPLPRGYAKRVSIACNCSLDAVYHTRMGVVKNDRIVLELLKLADEEIKRLKVVEEEKSKILQLFDFPIEF